MKTCYDIEKSVDLWTTLVLNLEVWECQLSGPISASVLQNHQGVFMLNPYRARGVATLPYLGTRSA